MMHAKQRRPTVSVIIPAYRAAKTLASVVEGELAQTEAPFEIVIVCDGVADATLDVAAALAQRHPSVRAIGLPENVGVARARDAGVRAARGDFVLFADADDSAPSTALESLVDVVVATGADVAVGGAEALLPNGELDFVLRGPFGFETVSPRFAFRLMLRGVITGHLWNKLVRRSVLEDCLPLPVSDVHSDLALTARVLSRATSVAFTPEIVYRYHANAGSILKSGRSRRESLDTVEEHVRRAAIELDRGLVDTDDYRYFAARFISLSRVKDALIGPYESGLSQSLARYARGRLSWRDAVVMARRCDVRHAAMVATAKVAPRLHKLALARARNDVEPIEAMTLAEWQTSPIRTA